VAYLGQLFLMNSMLSDSIFTFSEKLKAQLQLPLPGYDAQYKMAREFREHPRDTERYHINARLGAVLILFYPKGNAIHTVLIQRPAYEGVHSAQVAFPGGRKEEADADLIETALREASEEVGIDKNQIMVGGKLTHLYVPPSNFLVTPVVGFAASRPDFRPQKHEVAEIIEVDLPTLLDEAIISEKIIELPYNMRLKVKCYDIFGRTVWGATAMIIAELNELLKKM
jgi:8-oxo-dGTP pyrophosphatase MutT (NUDIX family)